MSKRFWIILIIAVGAMVGAFLLSGGKAEAPKSDKFADGNLTSIKESDHKVGAGNKKVTMIEYGDFQCPGCGGLFPIIDEVKNTYKDDITFVFRHFPLTQIHPNAQAAHRAAEAASNQGKFFEMHDLLYINQQLWQDSKQAQTIFEGYAEQLELNMDQFRADAASEAANAKISADVDSGKQLGVTGTPTIFINGEKLEQTPRSLEEFKKVIDEAITKANQ